MKKTILSLALAAAVLFGAVSCDRNPGEGPKKGTAQLTVNYGFADPQVLSKAPNSTAKPETNWNVNIQSLTLILTNSAGTITHAIAPTVPTMAGMAQQTMATLTDIVQDNYTVYLIANAASSITTSPYGAVATNPSLALIPISSLVGKSITALNLNMVAATGLPTGINSANQEPTEIFWAKSTVTVGAGNHTVNLALERAVSLLRIRINKDYEDAGVAYNAGVKFNVPEASLVLRRTAGTGIAVSTGAVTGTADAAMFSKKPFKTANPASGYFPTDMGLGGTDKFTCWNDYLILPGGDLNVNAGFDIVITGLAPVGYVARNNQGVELAPLTAEEPVFWTAGVSGVALKNGILELNVTLKSKGVKDDVPNPATYGNLEVTATLLGWGNITSVDVPI